MELQFKNITKDYKGKKIVKGISLTMGTEKQNNCMTGRPKPRKNDSLLLWSHRQ